MVAPSRTWLVAVVVGGAACRQLLGIDSPIVGDAPRADGRAADARVDAPIDGNVTDAAVADNRFIQGSAVTATSSAAATAILGEPVAAGDLIVVAVGASDGTMQVRKVFDSFGSNTYTVAAPVESGSDVASEMFYVVSTGSGTDHVAVSMLRAESFLDVRVGVYRGGLADIGALGSTVDAANGAAGTSDDGAVSLTTTHANDLVVAANYTDGVTAGAGAGLTLRELSSDNDLLEDRGAPQLGAYTIDAPLQKPATWVVQAVAFSGE